MFLEDKVTFKRPLFAESGMSEDIYTAALADLVERLGYVAKAEEMRSCPVDVYGCWVEDGIVYLRAWFEDRDVRRFVNDVLCQGPEYLCTMARRREGELRSCLREYTDWRPAKPIAEKTAHRVHISRRPRPWPEPDTKDL